jgi:broad specificity phosphatase PhoE
VTTLVLVRHGQASFGKHNYDVLSEIGERQSRILGGHLATLEFTFDAAYSGAMSRQRRTGEEVLRALQRDPASIREHAGFNEYNANAVIRAYLPLIAREHPGFSIEKRELFTDRKRFQQFFELIIGAWITKRGHAESELETFDDFCARCIAGLREVAPPDAGTVVIFTSGGMITAALREALKLDPHHAFQLNWRIYNASVHRFHLGRRGLSLLGYNNVTHLETARDPALLTFR